VRPYVCVHKIGRLEVLMLKRSVQEMCIERSCAFCEFGTVITLSSREKTDVICEKHGIVPRDHVCRNFRYDLLKREPQEKPSAEDTVASEQG
jgi:hypothetical protein